MTRVSDLIVAGNQLTLPVRVYFEDTDSGGIVYYANYLKYMERARTEYLRALGFEQDRLQAESQRLFVVASANVRYLQPARFNDLLQVSAVPEQCRKASLLFKHVVGREEATADHIGRHAANQQVLCEAEIRVACLNSKTYKPSGIPPELLEAMNIER